MSFPVCIAIASTAWNIPITRVRNIVFWVGVICLKLSRLEVTVFYKKKFFFVNPTTFLIFNVFLWFFSKILEIMWIVHFRSLWMFFLLPLDTPCVGCGGIWKQKQCFGETFFNHIRVALRTRSCTKDSGNERIRSRQKFPENLSTQLWKTKKLE